jgi:hypothetical protein
MDSATPPTRRLDADMPRCKSLVQTHAGMAYVTATVTVWDRDPAIAAEKLRLVEKVIQGRDFTVTIEGMNAHRGVARIAPRPHLRQCPAAAHFHHQSRPHDPPKQPYGREPERDEHFRSTPLALRQDRGKRPRSAFPFDVGDVGHTSDRRPDRRGQIRAARADGAAVPPLRRQRRSSPSTSADRSAPPRSAWAATGRISAARCMPTKATALPFAIAAARPDRRTPANAPGPPNGWRRSSPAKAWRLTLQAKEHLWSALDIARVRAGCRAHTDWPRRAAAEPAIQAGARSLSA